MASLNLGLVIHNHQPVGQHSWVLEAIYKESYLPLLEALERNSHVRLSLHYTGCLLDWIVPNRPEFIERLRALVTRGQVELLTGGYYEPILVAIPESDALAQINRLTSFLASTFDVSPQGMWLAERVWEPHLPGILARAGVDWTVLDDTHFRLSGVPQSDLRGYYVTEDRGDSVKLVATSKRLRELIPWADVETVVEFLRSQAADADDDALLVMGDDGEKFGSWPGTFDHVWKEGWMQRFFDALEANSDWLTTVPTGEYIAGHPSRGRVYIPAASYEEMMEWALPAEASFQLGQLRKRLTQEADEPISPFLGGGLWRNFLAKYSEVNVLHKKVLRVHDKLATLESAYLRGQRLTGTSPAPSVPPSTPSSSSAWTEMPRLELKQSLTRGETSPLSAAWEHLWAAECNCPYWHGVFGGIYLRDIRHALFKHAIEAEAIADSLTHKGEWLEVTTTDHDRDGSNEVLAESESANLYLAPHRGGALFEWDLKHPPMNLATALRRRPEAYHQAVREARGAGPEKAGVESIHNAVKLLDENLEEALVYDWHERWCLIEHFLDRDVSLDEFAAGHYKDRGDFALKEFACEPNGERTIVLEREGSVTAQAGRTRLMLRKVLESSADGRLAITYVLTHVDGPAIACNFGSEWNLSPLLYGADYAPVVVLNGAKADWSSTEPIEFRDVGKLSASSATLGLTLGMESNPAATLWSVPIEAASASEKGFERTYQGQCLYLQWPLALATGATARFGLDWRPSRLNP
ncbi:MAG TPA: alpha-amylase/4-alpha-glucanotransferase domain-containing protein [Dehalococcoidia bacterium]|nr:alpha-amylase/4-alpha-glucanotransferase domain-containing protein [Dehalococcoidia bacterium]